MNEGGGEPGGDGARAYSYRPSLLGAPWEFTLAGGALDWQAGRKSGRIALRDISRVRLSFRPVTMQSQRFLMEVWADGAPKLEICSSSWKSMVEQVRLDAEYAGFIGDLHRRLAEAGVAARFEQGSNPLLYWPGLIFFAAVALGLAALTVRALQAHALGGAAFVGGFFLLFLWQGGNFFRRNRPGVYRPEALPRDLVPKG
jgi:hypothetical protein